ncbi:uncharacterized protein IWZ02DRAFT_456610 [Phyllosticta citriasiana]|uniref:uncharacterized protein n=1 Tax=Phyllosticta citriasiana TaxID=595635 RepID=UPI0030FD8971
MTVTETPESTCDRIKTRIVDKRGTKIFTGQADARFTECVLQQADRRFFLDHMKEHSDMRWTRRLPMSLDVDERRSNEAYPITNREMGGTEEVLKAKYVLAVMAHTAGPGQLGFEKQGEATDFIWGVLDIIPITDFPDIRQRCIIHSADQGTLMVIPRERGLVRLYIQLKEIVPDAASGRADRSKITPDIIFKAAQKILSPYQLRYNYCDWWTAYQIGQRVSPSFSLHNRIFLAGDAVHTHSPKAGQGMNVSMADGYNLGWKLALTVQKLSATRTSLLMADLRAAFDQNALFTSVSAIPHDALPAAEAPPSTPHANHPPPKLIPPAPRSPLATRLPIARASPATNAGPSPPFRILLFAGNMVAPAQSERVRAFCRALESGLLRTFTPPNIALNTSTAPLQVLTIHSAPREDVELLQHFPAILHPFDEQRGWDYERVWCDAPSYHEDGERGAVVVVRPDQVVAWVGDVEEAVAVEGGGG